MSHSFNLKIAEYDNSELEELFQLKFPFTVIDITNSGQKMKRDLLKDSSLKEEDKRKVHHFIDAATSRLHMILTNKNLNLPLSKSAIVETGGHMIISPPTTSYTGKINPMTTDIWDNLDKLMTKTINIDTIFRDNYYNTKATDFHVTLPLVMKNVISMKLAACELPFSIYTVSTALENNFFTVIWDVSGGIHGGGTHNEVTIVIPDGNYDSCTTSECSMSMVDQLNFELLRPQPHGTGGDVVAAWDKRTGKMIIALDPSTNPLTTSLQLQFNTDISGQIQKKPIQLNLGWTLGYRFGAYTGSTAYVSEGIYDFRGPRYLYLVVNDYNNNHPESIIGTFNESITVPKNILARLSWKEYAFFSTTNNPLSETQTNRQYFGPVDIQKLHIQLTDQFGRVIALNNMDWALALEFSCLYKV